MQKLAELCAELLQEEELLITSVCACVSVRLRELREDCAPLQPHSPVCLWNRGLPPYLCIRGGGPQDGGELRNGMQHAGTLFTTAIASSEPPPLFAVQTQ